MMTRSECVQWLSGHDHFCILTHGKPDGDTLGSAALLCRGLRALGKQAVILENEEADRHLAPLCLGLTVSAPDEEALLVTVDVADAQLLPGCHQQYLPRIALRIDHHGRSTGYCPLELVDPTAAACGEILYDLLMELGVTLDIPMAQALYVAISTDTGCFRFANTTAHTFLVAAACAETGAALQPINQVLFDTVTLQQLRLQAWTTENAQFFAQGKGAICAISQAVTQDLQVSEEETSGLSGFLRSIEGVCMAATVKEVDGWAKISMRAVPGYNAAAVCECFGGGGHKGAAGGKLPLPLEQAAAQVKAAMEAHIFQQSKS